MRALADGTRGRPFFAKKMAENNRKACAQRACNSLATDYFCAAPEDFTK
jgi:hypothetical protein